jgi:hypothetical protein
LLPTYPRKKKKRCVQLLLKNKAHQTNQFLPESKLSGNNFVSSIY